MDNSEIVLISFDGVSKFKSVFRAVRRGHVSPTGVIYPNRPYNNRANTSKRKGVHSRAFNQLKRDIYDRFINKNRV